MILVIFIFVVVFYQYLSYILAKREEDALAKRIPRPTIFHILGDLVSKLFRRIFRLIARLFSCLSCLLPRRARDDYDFSCRGSTVGLLRPSQRKEQGYFSKLCAGNQRAPAGYKQKALERGTLRPLLLQRQTQQSSPLSPLTPNSPRTPIDMETQEYLRSPTAFEFDELHIKATHRRSKHVWSKTPPLVIRKKSDGYSLVEYQSRSSKASYHQSYRSPYDPESPYRDCTREESDSSSTYSSYPPTPTSPITPGDDTSSLYTISEEQDLVVIKPGEEDYGGYLHSHYQLSLPAHAKKKDEVFVIGDASESDYSADDRGR